MITLMEPARSINAHTLTTDAPLLFRRRDDDAEIYRVLPAAQEDLVEVQVLTPKWEWHEWRRGFVCRVQDLTRFLSDELRGWEPIDATALPTAVLGAR